MAWSYSKAQAPRRRQSPPPPIKCASSPPFFIAVIGSILETRKNSPGFIGLQAHHAEGGRACQPPNVVLTRISAVARRFHCIKNATNQRSRRVIHDHLK